MLCKLFYFNLWSNYVVKYLFLFFLNTHGYLWILKNYAGTRITDTRRIWGYEYGYETNIYPVGNISAIRAFDHGCFWYFVPILEPRHIRTRLKGWLLALSLCKWSHRFTFLSHVSINRSYKATFMVDFH